MLHPESSYHGRKDVASPRGAALGQGQPSEPLLSRALKGARAVPTSQVEGRGNEERGAPHTVAFSPRCKLIHTPSPQPAIDLSLAFLKSRNPSSHVDVMLGTFLRQTPPQVSGTSSGYFIP